MATTSVLLLPITFFGNFAAQLVLMSTLTNASVTRMLLHATMVRLRLYSNGSQKICIIWALN